MQAVEVPSNILLPAAYDVFWSAVCFAIIAFVLGKMVLPRFRAMLDERAEKIEGGLLAGQEARAEAAEMRANIDADIHEARVEAGRVRQEADEAAKRIIADAKKSATLEAERIAANAMRQIEAERQSAEISLRTDVGLLASELASRIVGETLRDGDAQARVIDRFLDELAAQSRVTEER